MLVSEILRSLPDTLEWMVLFNLASVGTIAREETIKQMYFLPEETELAGYSHVVLSSRGRYLASLANSDLIDATTRECLVTPKRNLAIRFQEQLSLFDVDSADCLGLGEKNPYAPVLLHLSIQEGVGKAQAIFDNEPCQEHYELLRAVGVTFKGGEYQGDYYLAQFQNRLPVHIHAGIISHFTRTAHCNLFFLQQGNIDSQLELGLIEAATTRIEWGKQRTYEALLAIAVKASQESLSMTCLPPPPEKPFAYGNLVPLGFILKALKEAQLLNNQQLQQELASIEQRLTSYLFSQQQEQLWAFASDRLITATDSALILQALELVPSIKALEKFADGKGGYYPQLWSETRQPHKMLVDDACQHWCQTDYGTTCLITALRQQVGLSVTNEIEFLKKQFATRSGLFFANPYLVDYFLALAIANNNSTTDIRKQLLDEVLESRNPDFSFGAYDLALSTALAILIMKTLNYQGRTLQATQLRLLELMQPNGAFAESIPFYSSLRIDHEIKSPLLLGLLTTNSLLPQTLQSRQAQIRAINGEHHSISLYLDTHKMITTSLAAIALGISTNSQVKDIASLPLRKSHSRYRCRTQTEYITQFALPPYIQLSTNHENYINLR